MTEAHSALKAVDGVMQVVRYAKSHTLQRQLAMAVSYGLLKQAMYISLAWGNSSGGSVHRRHVGWMTPDM